MEICKYYQSLVPQEMLVSICIISFIVLCLLGKCTLTNLPWIFYICIITLEGVL
jgi:hypothetical protein